MAEQTGCLFATMLAERQFTGTEMNRQGRQDPGSLAP